MAQSFLHSVVTATLAGLLSMSAHAQNEEDFQSLVKRYMTRNEATVRSAEGAQYDSALWHGGAFIGVGSEGRVQPHGYFTYHHGRLNITGDITGDISERATTKDVLTTFDEGGTESSQTDLMTHYQHENANLQFDFHQDRRNTFTLDFFQKYNHDKVSQNAVKNSVNATSTYQEQEQVAKDRNGGALLQHRHDFSGGGLLRSRLYVKYDNKLTTVDFNSWSTASASVLDYAEERYTSIDPKAEVWYQSPQWSGFFFDAREKLSLLNMEIQNVGSEFDYDVRSSLTTLSATYQNRIIKAHAGAEYESYHHTIKDFENPNIDRTYRDLQYKVTFDAQLSSRQKLQTSYVSTITRPTYTQLYPFAHIGSSISYWIMGNTALEPSRKQVYKVLYGITLPLLKLNTSVSYEQIDDEITQISSHDMATDHAVKTWINDTDYQNLLLALEGEVKQGPFEMTFGAHAKHIDYSGDTKTDKAWSYSFKMRPQVHLPNEWTLACVLLYTGREQHLHYYNRSYMYGALRAYKQLGDWTLYALMQDIFERDHRQVLISSNSTIVTDQDLGARALILGCSYRF